jgi:hypothetical protein
LHEYINNNIPVVAICNYVEAFYSFLKRDHDETLLKRRQYADRDFYWLGNKKLLITAVPISDEAVMRTRWGYDQTYIISPGNPSPSLCQDILREKDLLEAVIRYAGDNKTLQLIPYMTSREFLALVRTLEEEHGLTILLPESPTPENVWVRDYIDTKVGFRVLVSQWLKERNVYLPFGIICASMDDIIRSVQWFNENGKTCIIKASDGGGGYGNAIITSNFNGDEALYQFIEKHQMVCDCLTVVEEFITSEQQMFPSLEMFVPPLGQGEPLITYLSNQIFSDDGGFAGVMVSRDLYEQPWYTELERSGTIIAKKLQEMGYIGHFDLDTILDDEGRLYLMEVNSRRTGGTHAHEFATFKIGKDYLDHVSIYSHTDIETKAGYQVDQLITLTDGLLYPINKACKGLVFTSTSLLAEGSMGAMFVGSTPDEALGYYNELIHRLQMNGHER